MADDQGQGDGFHVCFQAMGVECILSGEKGKKDLLSLLEIGKSGVAGWMVPKFADGELDDAEVDVGSAGSAGDVRDRG